MEKIALNISDFQLFVNTIQNILKITEDCKITINKNGLVAFVADKYETVRMDIKSNAISIPSTCDVESVSICTKKLTTISQFFMKIVKSHVSKLKKGETPDYSDVMLMIDDTSLYIKSSVLKATLFLENEAAVYALNGTPYPSNTIMEIDVAVEDLKDIITSTSIFKKPEKTLIKVCHQNDMIKNIAYAYLSDPTDPRSNQIMTKFGNIMSGDITRDIFISINKIKFLSLFNVKNVKMTFNAKTLFYCDFENTGISNCQSTYRILAKYDIPRTDIV